LTLTLHPFIISQVSKKLHQTLEVAVQISRLEESVDFDSNWKATIAECG